MQQFLLMSTKAVSWAGPVKCCKGTFFAKRKKNAHVLTFLHSRKTENVTRRAKVTIKVHKKGCKFTAKHEIKLISFDKKKN